MWTADWVVPLKDCLKDNCFLELLLRKWRRRGGNDCRLTTRASCVGLIMVMILLLHGFSFATPAGTGPQPAEFAIVHLGGPPTFSAPALLAADYTLASWSSSWLCSFYSCEIITRRHTHTHTHTHTHRQIQDIFKHVWTDAHIQEKCAHRHVWQRL